MNDHFAAGAFFAFNPDGWEWYVLGVTNIRYPSIVKLPGGTNKEFPKETPGETLKREFKEETGLKTLGEFLQVYSVRIPGGVLGSMHTKYFYLVKKISGDFPFGDVREFDDGGCKLRVRWWNLQDFERALLTNHKDGFTKAFIAMANFDEKFCQDNLDMVDRYSRIKC